MKAFVAPTAGEIGKFLGVVQAFPDIWKGRILDIGSRTGHFRKVLPDNDIDYVSLDIFPPANLIGNIEIGLPFVNQSVDISLALDVLEHTNDFHRAFNELCRVTRKYIIISLPNAYDIQSRWRYVKGQPISGKYGLPLESKLDRHRWLFSFTDASHFFHSNNTQGFEIVTEGGLIGPRRNALLGQLTRRFPQLLFPTYLVLLRNSKKS